MARRAWVLNLDADLELGAGPQYAPRESVRAAMRARVERLAAGLLGRQDLLVDEDSPPLAARGLPGRAFSPTPRALAVLRRAGAEPEPHPSVEVLRRVTSRAFASGLGATLPGAAFVTDGESARAKLQKDPRLGETWRVKHAFGMAGRNHRVLRPGPVTDADLAFLRAGLERGGVQIEPQVVLVQEVAIHGVVAADGSLRAGALVRQRCDARGAWVTTEPIAPGSEPAVASRMAEELRRVADALHGAGYFGPFGIDAFSYSDRDGRPGFQPRSEVNARYSMGFAVGLGASVE
jgi:hypothetical protein